MQDRLDDLELRWVLWSRRMRTRRNLWRIRLYMAYDQLRLDSQSRGHLPALAVAVVCWLVAVSAIGLGY
jgi:hypothetical protein